MSIDTTLGYENGLGYAADLCDEAAEQELAQERIAELENRMPDALRHRTRHFAFLEMARKIRSNL